MIKKTIFKSFVVLWASLDLATLAGAMIFCAGLILAVYIWIRWGTDGNNEGFQEQRIE